MINVSGYIRELLFTHDCVILPSLGGFIGNYTPARIDNATNTFSPPVKAISFNRNLNNNDGLLISKISADRGIGYADSRRLVEEYIEDLKRRLNKGERVMLDLIGHFQNNSEGNVLFEPDRNSNFLLDSYGLPSFTREPIANYDVTARVLKRRDLDSKPVITRKMAWRAAIAVPVIAIMILVPLKTNFLKNSASLNPLAKSELEEVSKPATESVIEEAGMTPAEEIVSAGIVSEAVGEQADRPQVGTKEAYQLITGSFKSRDNAVRQIEDLNSRGYNGEISSTSNGYFRVVASSYTTYTDATRAKEIIEKNFPGTWVLKKQ